MKITIRQKLLLFSFIILAGIGLSGYAVYKSNQKLLDSEQWVQHTQQVIYQSGNILSLAKDIETASRGFIITNDSAYLEPLFTAEKTTFAYIRQLRQLTRDNPAQQQRVDSLSFYMHKRLDFSNQTVELRSKQGLASVIANVSGKQGKYYTDHLRQITNDIQQEENILLKQRQQANEHSVRVFNRLSVATYILMAVFTILLLIVTGNYLLQRQKYEGELVKASNEIKDLYDNAPCGYFSVDANILLANINQTLLNWLGYTVGEVLGKMKYEDLLSPKSRTIHLETFDTVFAGYIKNGYVNDLEYEFQRKDGTIFPALVNSIAVLDENGAFIKSRSTVFDNTERKKAEEQLKAVNKELESFSYSVSHDLRAPLRAVHGYTQILKEDFGTQLDGEANRVMNNIMNNAKKMGQLIDDLLAFSRLGRKELVKTNIRMQEMVTNLCGEIKSEQAGHDIQFVINELPPVQGDSIAIRQVWVNLISNAVKYSRQKEKAIIEIGSENKVNEIIYYIKDNGAGFDMRYAGKLFGVFQRLHSDAEFEGNGVGLAIVQRIISKHGGRVWAEGKTNEGATFYFSLIKS